MKLSTSTHSLALAAMAAAMLHASPAQATTTPGLPNNRLTEASPEGAQNVGFRDSAEADQLRRAYRILATGDHDYKGHRVRAMHAVEAAGKLLGLNLSGDLRDRTPQRLSDERLREAQGLIAQVLNSAEVKGQARVVKHLNVANQQINVALSIR